MIKSVYDSPKFSGKTRRHIITVLVDNEPGVLARVVGMFSGRGYNIDSLNVAEILTKEQLSRITIVTHGTDEVVDLIRKQLMTIVPVHSVTNLQNEGSPVEAEVALVYLYVNNSNKKELEERVKELEERLEKLIELLRSSYSVINYDEQNSGWTIDLMKLREPLNNL